MKIVVRGEFDPFTPTGADNIDLCVALAEHADLALISDRLQGPLPGKFKRLLDADANGDHDAFLHLGDPSRTAPEQPRAAVYAHPAYPLRPRWGWSKVIVTNPDRAADLDGRAAVVPLGVAADRMRPVPRPDVRALVLGDVDTAGPVAGCLTEEHGIPTATMTGDTTLPPARLAVYQRCSVAVCPNAADARYAAEYAATGGCVVAAPVDDLANLVNGQWAVPVDAAAAPDEYAAAAAAVGRARAAELGRVAAGWVRTALSWEQCAIGIERQLRSLL